MLALQILNVSIDAPILQGDNLAKPLVGFNYIDSYVEYVSEVILKYENAIPETGKHQQKELQQHKMPLLICSNENIQHPAILFCITSPRVYFNLCDNYVYRHVKEINAPPEFRI